MNSRDEFETSLLTCVDLARKLRMKVGWVYRHAEMLGGFKLGKYWRFDWLIVQQRLHATKGTPSGMAKLSLS